MPEHDLSIAEFAALIGICRQTAWNHVRTGRVPGYKIGGQWRIRREAVEALRAGSA